MLNKKKRNIFLKKLQKQKPQWFSPVKYKCHELNTQQKIFKEIFKEEEKKHKKTKKSLKHFDNLQLFKSGFFKEYLM